MVRCQAPEFGVLLDAADQPLVFERAEVLLTLVTLMLVVSTNRLRLKTYPNRRFTNRMMTVQPAS